MSNIDYHEGRRHALRILETFQGMRTAAALDEPIRNLRAAIKRRPGSWADGVASVLRELKR